MTLPVTRGDTVTIARREVGGQDPFGNDVYETVTTEVPGCALAPRSSSEDTDSRDQVIVGVTLYAPYDTDIRATDTVTVAGVEYEVDGAPGYWRSPLTGTKAGVQVALRRVAG